MAIINTTERPLISIYFCGGTGYNLGYKFTDLIKDNAILTETVSMQYLDASTANNHEYNTEDNTLVLGNGKGSGKVRGANAEDIMDAMTPTLHKFKPGVFNIMVGGASGGSGSTIINCLSSALAERGIDAINVLVGSRASATEIKNTNKTFTSFANQVQEFDRPVVIHYRENTTTTKREDVDGNILNNLIMLCLLLSGKDDKMDISDLNNLLNYPKVTDFPAAIVGMDLFLGEVKPEKHELVLAAATLAAPGADTTITPTPEYQTAGYIKPDVTTLFNDIGLLHWCIIGNSFTPLMRSMATRVKEFEEAAKAVKLDNFVSPTATKSGRTLVV